MRRISQRSSSGSSCRTSRSGTPSYSRSQSPSFSRSGTPSYARSRSNSELEAAHLLQVSGLLSRLPCYIFGICVLAISDQLRIFQTLHCWKIILIGPNIIVFFSDPLFFSRCCWPHQGTSVALNPGELRARPVCSWGSSGFSSFDKKSTFLLCSFQRGESQQ